jgi:hypothetical protein
MLNPLDSKFNLYFLPSAPRLPFSLAIALKFNPTNPTTDGEAEKRWLTVDN